MAKQSLIQLWRLSNSNMKLYGEATLFVSVEMSSSQKENASINSMVKAKKVTAKNILYTYIVILTKIVL